MSNTITFPDERMQLIRVAMFEIESLAEVLKGVDPSTETYEPARRGILSRIYSLTKSVHALTCSDEEVVDLSDVFSSIKCRPSEPADIDAIREIVASTKGAV